MDEFDRKVAFYRSCGQSQGSSALTMALIRSTVPYEDRPAVRAARLLLNRSSGRDRRKRIAWERQEWDSLN